ncbi:hypothetical protein BD410DRAFT_846191 [Rickenella mellea]|uniref:Uncharacterized protein n=1 Tax=Rickenella mellea TaxID=50990 RepID=A0A4Y7PG15_9AGAM|nr:hypothetical protein BD410DRAFT_846191 [Rickenella mellea]
MTPLRQRLDRPDSLIDTNTVDVYNGPPPLAPTSESSTTTTRRRTQAATQASAARASATHPGHARSRVRPSRSAATSSTAVIPPDSPTAGLPTIRSQPEISSIDDGSHRGLITSESVRTLTLQDRQPATATSRTASMSISSRPSSESSVTNSSAPRVSTARSQYSAAGSDRFSSSFIQPPPEDLVTENHDLR